MSTVYMSRRPAPAPAPARRADRPSAAVPLCVAGLCAGRARADLGRGGAGAGDARSKTRSRCMTSRCSAARGWTTWRTPCCTCSNRCCTRSGRVIVIAVALTRGRPRLALAVALVLSLAPLTAEMLKPLLAHPHACVGGGWVGAGVVAERSRHGGDGARACARCSWRQSACARSWPRWAWCSRPRRLLAADPRLAPAERRPGRLPGGHAVDGPGRGRSARRRGALAAITQAREAGVRAVGAGVP